MQNMSSKQGSFWAEPLSFGTVVQYSDVEREMLKWYGPSTSSDDLELVFDLSNTGFISPLALCLISSWAVDAKRSGTKISLHPPSGGNQATSFFATAGLVPELKRSGVFESIPEPESLHARERYLSAFRAFDNEANYRAYISELSSTKTRQLLLHSGSLPEFMESGDFHRIALRELADNCFLHAGGANVRYAVYGYETSTLIKDEILAHFTKKPYVELVVADSPTRGNLHTTVAKASGAKHDLEYKLDGRSLQKMEKEMLAAFEYAVTSSPSRRAERISKYISNWSGVPSSIGTGLHSVLLLAGEYRAQVIVRAARRIFTIDYSQCRTSLSPPRVKFIRKINGQRLAPLRGTIMCIRTPFQKASRSLFASRNIRPETTEAEDPGIALVPIPSPSQFQEESWSESRFLSTLAQHVETVTQEARNADIIAIVLDGISASRNEIIAFLDYVSTIRRRHGLVVLLDDRITVALAGSAWANIASDTAEAIHQEAATRAAIVVGASAHTSPIIYGNEDAHEATRIEGEQVIIPDGRAFYTDEVIRKIRLSNLQKAILSRPVHHRAERTLYLVENRYYTTEYFEIAQLGQDDLKKNALVAWLADLFLEHTPSIVIINKPYMRAMVEDSLGRAGISSDLPVKCLEGHSLVEVVAAVNEECGDVGHAFVWFDVICTGNSLKRFLETTQKPSNTYVFACVDARNDETTPPLIVSEASGYSSVVIDSVVRYQVGSLSHRPNELQGCEILVVDSSTNAPKRLALAGRGDEHDAQTLLETAERMGVLQAGHFKWPRRHSSYYLSLPSLLHSVAPEIQDWLRTELSQIDAIMEVTREKLTTYCISGLSGLYDLLYGALSASGVSSVVPLDVDSMDAPNYSFRQQGESIWFIVPSLDSPQELARLYDYASARECRFVRVSCIIFEGTPEALFLCQNLTAFKDVEVQFQAFYVVHIQSDDPVCSGCVHQSRLRNASRATLQNYPYLHAVIGKSLDRAQPIPAEIPSADDTPRFPDAAQMAHLRSLTERSRNRDIDARRLLAKALSSSHTAIVFAATTGLDLHSKAFSAEALSYALYKDASSETSCLQLLNVAFDDWLAELPDSAEPNQFAYQLRGFHRLTPLALRNSLSVLLSRISDSPLLVEEFLTHAAIEPRFYMEIVGMESSLLDKAEHLRLAYDDLKRYLLRGTENIFLLNDLRQHLVHSSGWRFALNVLRSAVTERRATDPRIREAFGYFSKDGVERAKIKLVVIRSSGYLKRVGNTTRFDSLWRNLMDRTERIGQLLQSEHINRDCVYEEMQQLEKETWSFVNEFDGIVSTRPEEFESVVRPKLGNKFWPEGSVRIILDADCRPLALSNQDCAHLMFYLLENARGERLPRTSLITTLSFRSAGGQAPGVVLEVSQNQDIDIPSGMLGGLYELMDLVTQNGGHAELNRRCPANTPFLRIQLWAWPLRSGDDVGRL